MLKIINKQVTISLLYLLLTKRQLPKTALTLATTRNTLNTEIIFLHDLLKKARKMFAKNLLKNVPKKSTQIYGKLRLCLFLKKYKILRKYEE